MVLLTLSIFAAYMSSPCHIELILSEKEEAVQKEVFCLPCFCFFLIFIACLIVLARFWLFKLNFHSDIFPARDPVGSKQEEGLNSTKCRSLVFDLRLFQEQFCCYYFTDIILEIFF